jgi:4-carboxymuconolactone decarboxylase
MDGIGGVGRFPRLAAEAMSLAQTQAYETLVGGARGMVPKPYQVWLCNPALTAALGPLGLHLTRGSSLMPRETEIAILVAARHWGAGYVMHAHSRIGQQAGLSPQVTRALCAGEAPALADARERAVYDATMALLPGGVVGSAAFARAKELLSDDNLTDLAALLGYYAAVAFTLNLYDVRPPVPGAEG